MSSSDLTTPSLLPEKPTSECQPWVLRQEPRAVPTAIDVGSSRRVRQHLALNPMVQHKHLDGARDTVLKPASVQRFL